MDWKELNQAEVTFESLRETGYNEEVLNAVKNESFESLRGNEFLKDIEAAKFILYACVNARVEMNYSIYAYLQEDVQMGLLSETNISNNILQIAPDVIENTPLAKDENAILANVNDNPEIVKYISNDVVDKPAFVSELVDKSPEVAKEMLEKYPVEKLIATNPELATNPAFMAEAIARDVTVIKFANEEIRNNYDVFAKAAKENSQVADYMLQYIGSFGEEAVRGAKDGTTESVREDTVATLKEASEKYSGYDKLKKQMKGQESLEREGKAEYKLRSNVGIYVKARASDIRANEEQINKIFNSIELTMEELRRELKDNPEVFISQTRYGALPTPKELKEMIEKSTLEDKEMFAERLAKYEKFRTMVKEHVSKEKEPKVKQEVVRETQEERDKRLRTTDTKSNFTKYFNNAREAIENKEKLFTPEALIRYLQKSELKDDKEAIAWLEQYTQYYEQIPGNTREEKIAFVKEETKDDKAPEAYNTELHVLAINVGEDGKVMGNVAAESVLEPAPEFVNRGIEEHGFPDNTIENNRVPEVSKNNIRTLNDKTNSQERTGH